MLYGKWRPSGFDEVVGQDHIVKTLRNALATGQVAHAYLFSGPRGTGKTTTARILARAVNCANLVEGNPCNSCPSCIAIGRGVALDLIEMDAASNRGIDDIRELREKIGFAPSDLKKKVYLLDEVHMLTQGAFNALLKTLEEPPPHAIFILATTELHQVPVTILSRCQRHDFHRVGAEPMVARLQFICSQEGFDVPAEGLAAIATQSRGGVRDAITLLEQVVARYGNAPSAADVLAALGLVHDERSGQLVRAIIDEDLATALNIARQVADDGIDIAHFTRECVDLLREMLPRLLRAQAGAEDADVDSLIEHALAKGTNPRTIALAIQELAGADFRLDPASPIPLEVACAAAILQPVRVPASVAAAPAMDRQAGTTSDSRGAARRSTGAPGTPAPPDAAATPGDRFLRDLYERCKMINVRMAGYLNGSCEVIAMDGDEIELGFYYPFHQQKVESDGRVVIEQQAEVILGRPMRLKTRLIDRDGAAAKKAPRGGHLAETAKSIGATPVAKE